MVLSMEKGIADLLQKVLQEMDLGTLKGPPCRVAGGLMHTMYAAVTERGKYAVKVLKSRGYEAGKGAGEYNFFRKNCA